MTRDLRYALRNLRKTPGFTLTAIATLALGLGANTAIFSVVNGVLLQPYPYPNAPRVVFLRETLHGEEWGPASVPDFQDWRQQSRSFAKMATFQFSNGLDLTGHGEARRLPASTVSQNLFDVLGIQPKLGRFFTDADMRSSANLVVISENLWRNSFNADPHLLGRPIRLSGALYTVIGVVPANLRFPDVSVWLPEHFDEASASARGSHWLQAVGLLKPGVTVAGAQSELDGIARRLAAAYPADNTARGVLLVPFTQESTRFFRPMLLTLLACVGFVLLIACANVGNLLLARGTARQLEVAIRTALGASRGQLIRQFLLEGAVISLAGGVLGLILATWSVPVLLSWLPEGTLPRQNTIHVDGIVLWFTLALTLLTPLIFGVLPALSATQSKPVEALKHGARSGTSGATGLLRSSLIVTQYALAVVLLIGGGLMLKTFQSLRHVDPGFRPAHTIAVELHQLLRTPADLQTKPLTVETIADRVRHIPGVQSVSQTVLLPMGGFNENSDFRIAGQPIPARGSEPVAETRFVSPGYLSTIGMPLLSGHDLPADGRANSPRVAVINQFMARKFFPDRNPLGERIGFQNEKSEWQWWQIVGVTGDARTFGLNQPVRYEIYIPIAQMLPTEIGSSPFDFTTYLIVRSEGTPDSVAASVRNAVRQVDPDLPIASITTLDDLVAQSIAQPRFESSLLTVFASLALLLAAAGLYGVMAYLVAQRTREIGVRVALGAGRKDIVRLVLSSGGRLIAIGAVLGVALSALLARLIQSALYGVSPLDPVVYVSVVALLTAVAFAACYIPARRASQVDPLIALRYE